MRTKINYFTTKTALGVKFCNRENERRLIKQNIAKTQHMVIVAPRRYGKTSLIQQTLQESKIHYADIDLFCAVYSEQVCEKIIRGVSRLVSQIMPFSEKTLRVLENCFKKVIITIKAGRLEIRSEYSRSPTEHIANITDVLEGLEKLAKKQKKRVVVFMDEFQDLLKADQTNEIQAAIRSIAQKSEYCCFIFSGSSRNMLKKIFEDRKQPLYMLCRKIKLDRISDKDFYNHIQTAAKYTWGKKLSDELVDEIFLQTELHPYYVNLLCDYLWKEKAPKKTHEIIEAWNQCYQDYEGKLIADLEPLTANQTKTLTAFALTGHVFEPNGKVFLDKVKIPLGTAQKAIKFLLSRDYIYKQENGALGLVDPLLKKYLIDRFG